MTPHVFTVRLMQAYKKILQPRLLKAAVNMYVLVCKFAIFCFVNRKICWKKGRTIAVKREK